MALGRDRVPHYVRGNASTRYPRRVVCMVTAERSDDPDGDITRHRCVGYGVRFIDSRPGRGDEVRTRQLITRDRDALWDWIEQTTRNRERCVLVAHDVARALRHADGWGQLIGRDWSLEKHSLGGLRIWLSWRKADRTLLCCDSESWITAPITIAARESGQQWPDAISPTATTPEVDLWLSDALDAYTAVVRGYLTWCESGDHGAWRVTGAGQGWASYRHRHMPQRAILSHDVEAALADERLAGWAGRTEAWRYGVMDSPLHEWDYRLSYPTIARDAMLPVRLRGWMPSPSDAQLDAIADGGRWLARVDVSTDVPIVPTSHDGHIVWPVGTFSSVLWDREVQLARSVGADLVVRGAWRYDAAPVMREWALWIIDQLHGPEPEPSPAMRRVIKGWARSVIGRWGMQLPVWEHVGTSHDRDLSLMSEYRPDTGDTGQLLALGHDLYATAGSAESPDSVPAIMTAITSEARVRLWEAICAAGADHVVYMDTDSLIVDAEGHDALQRAELGPAHAHLIHKRDWSHVEIAGPRQLILDHDPRISGLPKGAVRIGRGEWIATVTEGTRGALSTGRTDEVVEIRRTVRTAAHDPRRVHLSGGRTAPIRVGTP